MGKVFSMTQILCQEYFQACMYNSRKYHEDCEGFQGSMPPCSWDLPSFCEIRSRKLSSRLSACVLEILQGTNNELFFRERLEIPGDIYIFNTVLFTQSP